MRTINEVTPSPTTREAILLHGINELATLATGSHDETVNPAYGALRVVTDYAQSILAAAKAAGGDGQQPSGPTLPDPTTGEPYEVSRDDLDA